MGEGERGSKSQIHTAMSDDPDNSLFQCKDCVEIHKSLTEAIPASEMPIAFDEKEFRKHSGWSSCWMLGTTKKILVVTNQQAPEGKTFHGLSPGTTLVIHRLDSNKHVPMIRVEWIEPRPFDRPTSVSHPGFVNVDEIDKESPWYRFFKEWCKHPHQVFD
jgi:hypothetical protein